MYLETFLTAPQKIKVTPNRNLKKKKEEKLSARFGMTAGLKDSTPQ